MWTTFSTGLPPMDVLLVVDGIGPCQFLSHAEDGTVNVAVGHGRVFTLQGSHRWRRATPPR